MNKENITPEATEILASLNESIKEINFNTKSAAIASKVMLTMEETSWLTNLKPAYLYKLTSTRQIPFYKPNGKVLYFKREEVEAWMMRNRQDTSEEVEQGALKRLAMMDKQ